MLLADAFRHENEKTVPRRPRNHARAVLACILVLSCAQTPAHEFWLWPEPFAPAAGSAAQLTLHVGEYFEGNPVGFTSTHAMAMRHYFEGNSVDLHSRLPATAVLPAMKLRLQRAGAHVIAYDSYPSQLTLPAEKFHAYLHDEGLDAVIKQREAGGTAGLPGRERYRRCVKTLLRVGGASDATYAVRIGQRLEIMPLTDPYAKSAGDTLHFTLLFDDKPLAGALVKAWHKRDGQTILIHARTIENGQVALLLPYAGGWMISVVHMIRAADAEEADWDSFWGNLTFELPAKMKSVK
jgi:hypothetical protein